MTGQLIPDYQIDDHDGVLIIRIRTNQAWRNLTHGWKHDNMWWQIRDHAVNAGIQQP